MKRLCIVVAALFAGALVAPGQDAAETESIVAEIERLTQRLAERARKQGRPAGEALVRRTYDVTDLQYEPRFTYPPRHRAFRFRDLRSSWYEPPEILQMEVCGTFAIDVLVQLIRETCEPSAWERDGAALEPRNARLFAVTTPRVHKKIERLLATLRARMERRVAVEICAVRLREGEAARLAARPREIESEFAKELVARGVQASLSFSERNGHGVLHHRGRTARYIADYDAAVTKDAGAGDPILHELFAGFAAGVIACRDDHGKGALVEARLSLTAADEPFAIHPTPHGDIELPRLDVTRTYSTFWVPYGKPVLVGGSLSGDRPIVFLLTVRPLP